jgi:hypothetical protein
VVEEAAAASQAAAGGASSGGAIVIDFTPLLQQAQASQAGSPSPAPAPSTPPQEQRGPGLTAVVAGAAAAAALLAALGLLGWKVQRARRQARVGDLSSRSLGRLPAAWPSFKGTFMMDFASITGGQEYEAVGTEVDSRSNSISSIGAQRPGSPGRAAGADSPLSLPAGLLEGSALGTIVELQVRARGGSKAGAGAPPAAATATPPLTTLVAAATAAPAAAPRRGSMLAPLRPAAAAAAAGASGSPAAPAALQRPGSVPQLGDGEDWLGLVERLGSGTPPTRPAPAGAGAGAGAGGGAGGGGARRSATRVVPL